MTEEEDWYFFFFSAPWAARDEQARAHAQLRVSRAMSPCPPKTMRRGDEIKVPPQITGSDWKAPCEM